MGLNQVSFLPADVSSHAFNRQMAWEEPKQDEILISKNELHELMETITRIIDNQNNFTAGLQQGIERAGELLATHFPKQPDDKNELSDQVIES